MTDRQIHRPHNPPPPPANKCLLVPTLSVQPSTALKKLNFNCWIRIRIPNPDPDPDWRFESGSTRIRIRNTDNRYVPRYGTGTVPVPYGSGTVYLRSNFFAWVGTVTNSFNPLATFSKFENFTFIFEIFLGLFNSYKNLVFSV